MGIGVVKPDEEPLRVGVALESGNGQLIDQGGTDPFAVLDRIVTDSTSQPPGFQKLVEAPIPTQLCREDGIGDHAQGAVASRLEELGQGQVLVRNLLGRPVGQTRCLGIAARKDGGQRRSGLRPLCDCAGKRHSLLCQLVEGRRSLSGIAVDSHVVGTQCVDRDQEDSLWRFWLGGLPVASREAEEQDRGEASGDPRVGALCWGSGESHR